MIQAGRRRRRAVAVALLVVAALGIGWAVRHFAPGDVDTGTAAAHGATIVRYEIRSRHVRRTLPQTAAIPRGAADERRPLLVFLHGRGKNGEESNSNSDFYAALEDLGDRAPVVVFPNGGTSSYWHERAGGDWGLYVFDEVISQAVRRLNADPKRVAIGGISMGGYGAYAVASIDGTRFCAVGGHSPAIWLRAGDSAAGAFDDARNYARNDVLALARQGGNSAGAWESAELWLDGGDADPFRAGTDAFAKALGITARHPKGEHEGDYWRANYARYLRFYASALARCR